MKISTRGRYGIRLLIDLAENSPQVSHDGGCVTLASIAQRQGISARYLEQVAIILRRAGFIRSLKGAQGGYALSRPPAEINVGQALRALEGDMYIIEPLASGEKESRLEKCIRDMVFEPVNRKIAEVIDRETLADLTGTVDPDASYMYFI